MKKIVLMSAILLGTMSAFAQHEQHATAKKEEATKKEEYQCPMKCEGKKTYDKKGKCPSCGMDLKAVKK
ncbi:hypothetical protein EOJ36_03265 [Sandaracinomonas limnophila]|jgi:uncharacterized paraquat-inducible protein A|uniref:Heavy metal binding domain-containing protein n=1 Tax=Sandaracinomonas limnophila TaxID=1862386 RepID=A0A437PXR0_9BACT|nr:heavy metal-binding domain-containing protein [Sandaracinomonas limnophila]RVU27029.1 hypothetical protein EOJ36_03265 [Sandaracinomonas limnophila]